MSKDDSSWWTFIFVSVMVFSTILISLNLHSGLVNINNSAAAWGANIAGELQDINVTLRFIREDYNKQCLNTNTLKTVPKE